MKFTPAFFALVFSALAPQMGAAQKPQPNSILADYSAALEQLAKSASASVVQIAVKRIAPVEKEDLQRAGVVTEQDAAGSGVIVSADGFIVTNAHVVRNARRIEVKMLGTDDSSDQPHAHQMTARLIGLDSEVDIAVIKIEGVNLPCLSFLDSDQLRQGQIVLAAGSPLGLHNSLSHGIVSATARQLNPESPMVYIQTDAPINPGNSGGPLLDIQGKIAGINTMIISESGGSEGLGFAVPANLAKEVYQKLRKDGQVRRGAIGVIPETITPTLAAGLGLARDWGVILSDVAPGGPADLAGVQHGDVVLSINGRTLRESRDLGLAVFQASPGDVLALELQRGSERIQETVVVQERPKDGGQLDELVDYDAGLIRPLGIVALDLSEGVARILPHLRSSSGVVVAAVPADFVALNPGLVAGDVIYSMNNKPVESVDGLRLLLKDRKTGDAIVFLVERFGQLIYVTSNLE